MASRISTKASLAIFISVTAHLAAADYQLMSDSDCNCYVSNGTEVAYFTNHHFYDFRSLSEYQGEPAVLTSIDDSADASVTSQYFTTESWSNVWMIQSWNNSNGARGDATVWMQNSPNNIYIKENIDENPASQTYLTLRTQRLDDFQTAAEIESISGGFQYVSMRMLARTVGSSGACTAMFTYRATSQAASDSSSSSTDVQESDLEVRTKDPRNSISYTNQPSVTAAGDVIDQSTINATMPDGLDWSQWAVHRLDWTPNRSTWYVDGVEVASNSFQAPRDPSQLIINTWSDGGEWSGNMTVHDAAYLQIQWLEVVFNNTDNKNGKRDDGGCNTVCSIDKTSVVGTPVLISSSGAFRVGLTCNLVAWIPTVLVLIMSFSWSHGVWQ